MPLQTRRRPLLFTLFIFAQFCLACAKKPVPVVFENVKNHKYLTSSIVSKAREAVEKEGKDAKDYTDLFEECKDNITKKPGVIFSASLGRKLNATNVLLQVIEKKTGSVIFKHNGDTNPDMQGLSIFHNFEKRGEYLINFIAKDEIIAQGTIKYE